MYGLFLKSVLAICIHPTILLNHCSLSATEKCSGSVRPLLKKNKTRKYTFIELGEILSRLYKTQ